MAENAASLDDISPGDLWQLLLTTSSKNPEPLHVAQSMADGLVKGMQDLAKLQQLTADQKKASRRKSREDLKNLNLLWMEEMINSESQFRERMSLFWHGHFACRNINVFFQQQLLDIIRTNAFGNFGDLLRRVSKSPAMLQFLNNQQNRKKKPNENFARELMELFTMGSGHYSESDIKEAARAFTGWGFNLQGEFLFRANVHDDGVKTFLGKTGYWDGDDIIDLLLEQKETALFITRKVYRYFVNEQADEQTITWLANRFYSSGYDIKKLMDDIFRSDWFYADKNIGTRIKSPIDLLTGIRRFLPMELEHDAVQLLFQRALGQVLFYPPNVAGWPGGRSWIDSSTLMLRLRIPQILTANEVLNLAPKPDDDVMMGRTNPEDTTTQRKKTYQIKNASASVDWEAVEIIFDKIPREGLLVNIADALIQSRTPAVDGVLLKYINKGSRQEFIRTAIVYLMSTPEYQLC